MDPRRTEKGSRRFPMASPRKHAPHLNARRAEICITAAHVFLERGFDATSVSDIAAALGVTKAGLYHYFSSKERLLFEIISLGMDSIDAQVIDLVKGIRDPEARLREILVRHAELATCNQGVVTRMVDEMRALAPAQRKHIEKRKRRYFELVRRTLVELRSAGRLCDVDPTVAAFSVLGMIIWLPQWFRPDRRLTGEEVATEVTKLALGGLLARDQPPRSRKNRRRKAR